MSFIFVVLIVVVLILVDKNKNLTRENDKLKRERYTLTRPFLSFCPKCGCNLKEYSIPQVNQNQLQPQAVIESPSITKQLVTSKQPSKLTKEEQKNNMILITGAILIVLSAIIFLLSTWTTTGNITKTLIILLMLIIFLSISKISDNVFKLHQTSEVFFYISLCYLPIALLSISLFGLFGHYLSIFGSGKYIYFSISCLITSIIYILVKENHNSIFLKTITEVFLYLTTYFISLSLTTNIYIRGIIILTYTILRQYIALKQNNIDKSNKVTFSILTVIATNIIINYTLISQVSGIIPIEHSIYLILLLLNFYILFNKTFHLPKVYEYIYPILTILIFTSISNITLLELNTLTKSIIILLGIILVSTYDIIRNKTIKIPTLITTTITTISLCLLSTQDYSLKSSIILLVYFVLSFINYYITDKDNKATSYLLLISIVLLSLSVPYDLNITNSVILLVPELILLLSYIYKDINKNLKESCYIVGLSTMCLETLYLLYDEINYFNIILFFIGAIILIIYFIKDNKELNKNISYIIFTVSLISLFECLDFESNTVIPYGLSISTILITFLETIIDKLNTKNSLIYIVLTSIISLIFLNVDITILKFILITVINITLIYNNITYKRDTNIYLLVGLSLINSIFFSDILVVGNLNIMILIDILLIALTTYLSYMKKGVNQFTVISYIYITCTILFLDLNPYINYGMLLVSSYIHYVSTESKYKDIFNFILCTSLLLISRRLFKDIELLEITAINIGSFLIYFIIVLRSIIKKYLTDYKFLEYFIISILNIIAIVSYANELDGILYVTALIGLIIVSYTAKYGPTFIVSLIFVIINALLLTREFWFSIPWWIYVLTAGIILVLFAVKNEANSNKTKSKVEDIKKHLDL